jgi:hypothetical protein
MGYAVYEAGLRSKPYTSPQPSMPSTLAEQTISMNSDER